MPYTIYRVDLDGTKTVVGCVDSASDIGIVVDEDRQKIDWEAGYLVEKEGWNEPERVDP